LISGWGKKALPKFTQNVNELYVSAKTGEGVNELKEKLGHIINENKEEKYIIRDRLQKDDVVILVIPIDESAPKGRIILPQQNVLREVLDAHASAICTQVEELPQILKTVTPKYVITDSQAFNRVKDIVPQNIILTSFSILMANYKGQLKNLLNNAEKISELKDGDTVLISEGCTHHRQCNDIGTVKFPKWIKEYTGKDIKFEFTQGGGFPSDLSKYALIIHCGGCMLNEQEMKSRGKRAIEQNIPMVNYGMAIAYMNGILDRALKIFEK
jgi:[FeFe] hydrogenase H-cluster maturation GTPase HydF